MKNFVITIARENGSGGRAIGEALAQRLGVPFYNRDILRMASDDSGINESLFANAEKSFRNTLLFRVAKDAYNGEVIPPDSDNFVSNENLFRYQAKVMIGLAERESCVMIGRCADFILRDRPNVLRVFIHAPEEAVYLAHPLTASLGEVVVDGDNVYALAGQCVQISGKGSHKGLAFTGLHLCDTALMQDDTADDLYTVMTHTEFAPCCFTAGGKCLRQKLVERFAVLVALLEFVCLGAQLVVGQLFELLFECVHFIRNGVDLFQLVRRVRAENFGQKISHYFSSAFQKGAIAPFVTYTIVL